MLFHASGTRLKEYQIHGSEIADLEVAPTNSTPQVLLEPQPVKVLGKPPSVRIVVQPSSAEQGDFTDPAILSYARTPSKEYGAGQHASEVPDTPSKKVQALLAETVTIVNPVHIQISPTHAAPFSPSSLKPENRDIDEGDGELETESQLTGSGNLSSNGLAATKNRLETRSRKERKQKLRNGISEHDEPDSSPEVNRSGKARPNDWRRSVILEQAIDQLRISSPPRSSGFADCNTGRYITLLSGRKTRRTRRRPAIQTEAVNGWATEDATDVQELGDFDFIGNLCKFDKIAIFDRLRTEDTTADEDRLVSYNRVTAPGTFGGKKLHPSENVLEHPRHTNQDLPMSESESENPGDSVSSLKMKRTLSRTSVSQAPLRKGSSVLSENGNLTGPLIQLNKSNRLLGHAKYVSPRITTSPIMGGVTSPTLASNNFSATRKSNLCYVDSYSVCPTTSPQILRHLEMLSYSQLALNADILDENAARGIAEIALSAINPGGRRLDSEIHNSSPVIIVLVGGNIAGARALAAARHLHERGVRVIVSAPGYGTIDDIRRSRKCLVSQALRYSGSYMGWKTTSAFLKTLHAPPELIIDALLGIHSDFSVLDAEDRLDAMDMVGWANKSRASVLAVDIPSGVDGLTGEVEMREGEPAEVRAKIVVCCGMPTIGLHKAMELRQDEGEVWRVFVCDTAINRARRRQMVNFGSGWLVEVYLSAEDG